MPIDLSNEQRNVFMPEGQHFASASVLEDKKVFRDQALARISLLRRIVQDLEAAPGHTLPERHFLDKLEEHFGEDEAQAQLETAIGWGRYAELFNFQDERGIFHL